MIFNKLNALRDRLARRMRSLYEAHIRAPTTDELKELTRRSDELEARWRDALRQYEAEMQRLTYKLNAMDAEARRAGREVNR